MPSVFTLFTWMAAYLAAMLLLYCIACGMYSLADMAEESPATTKRVLKYIIWFVLAWHVVLLVFESFPLFFMLVGVASHLAYYMLLRTFPVLSFTSLEFLLSCVGVVATHIVWLWYFTGPIYFPVGHKMAFFFVCVWAAPFGFCLSLSVTDNVLPGNADGSMARQSRATNIFKSFVSSVSWRGGAPSLPSSRHKRA